MKIQQKPSKPSPVECRKVCINDNQKNCIEYNYLL